MGLSSSYAVQIVSEHGDGERCVAMGGTVDHSLFDERASNWCDIFNGNAKFVCNITGSMRASSKSCHSEHVIFFSRRYAVKPYTKKTLVQASYGNLTSCVNISDGDRRF